MTPPPEALPWHRPPFRSATDCLADQWALCAPGRNIGCRCPLATSCAGN
jgi:hypothetical protein